MHTLLLLVLLGAPALTGVPSVWEGPRVGDPPPAWAPGDTADALYRDARRALNADDMPRAAALFNQIHSRHPRSEYAADAFYWEAFARQRMGGEVNLRRALTLLEEQERRHPRARTRTDAGALATRIRGSLAEGGDRASSARLARAAGAPQADCADAELRSAALIALARSEPEQATALAREVLQRRDVCSTVLREHAVHLLGRQATPQASAALLQVVLTDPAPGVQAAALYALGRVGSSPRELIELYGQLREPRHREALIYVMQRDSSPEARAFLRGRILDTREEPAIREAALYATARGLPLRELIEIYGSLRDARLREATLYQIARSGDAAALAFLRERATDPAEALPLREAALYQVARRSDAAEMVRLYRRLDEAPLREAALYALARNPDGEAVPLLIEIARGDPDRRFRETAVQILGRSSDPRARQFLRELVTRP